MGFVDTSARTRRTIIAELDLLPAENFRKTLAAGVADFGIGDAFCSNETGEMRRYERIAAAPGYSDLGDDAAPASTSAVNAVRQSVAPAIISARYTSAQAGAYDIDPSLTAAQNGVNLLRALAEKSEIELTANISADSITVPASKSLVGRQTLTLTDGGITIGTNSRLDLGPISGGKANRYKLIGAADATGFVIRADALVQSTVQGIDLSRCSNFLIDVDLVDDMGTSAVNAAYQGMGLYASSCSDFEVRGGEWARTWGQAAIYLYNCADADILRVSCHDTRYRAIQVYGPQTAGKIIVDTPNIRRTGWGAVAGQANAGVGCNGIFIQAVTSGEIVEIKDADIMNVAENFIEGPCRITGGRFVTTGYGNLDTPSKEGIYIAGAYGTLIEGGTQEGAAEEGIKAFGTVGSSKIMGHKIKNPGTAGVQIQPYGSGVTVSDFSIDGVIVTQDSGRTVTAGINFAATGGATVDAKTSYVTNCKTNIANNSIPSGSRAGNNNTWEAAGSATPIAFDDGLFHLGKDAENAGGGFLRRYDSYAVARSKTTDGFDLGTTPNARTMWAHGNNALNYYVIPGSATVTGTITAAALTGYQRAYIDTVGLHSASSAWNGGGLLCMGNGNFFWMFGSELRRKGTVPTAGDDGFIIPSVLQTILTYDPPSLAAGATQSFTVTVTGARVGDFARASHTKTDASTTWEATVTADDTALVRQTNRGAATSDLASGTLRVRVERAF